jgi:type IX secretion system PorP/SprF family membrane protein
LTRIKIRYQSHPEKPFVKHAFRRFAPFLWLWLAIIFLIALKPIHGQDLHFSQLFNSPLNLNPALTAYTQANYRFILNQRSQWASVTVPYQTYSASFDTKLITRKRKGDFIGFGLIFNNDEAGDSKFGTTQAGLSLSWVKVLNKQNKNLLAIGMQASFFQRSIDYSQLYFPEQWNGSFSNIQQANSEIFSVNQFNYFDLSTGAHWFLTFSPRFKINTGLSAYHLNRPMQSLLNDEESRLSVRYQWYAEPEFELSKLYNLMPTFYFSHQNPYNELIVGARFYYKLHSDSRRYFALNTGLFIRNHDALILLMGIDYKQLKIAASYDFNVSPLTVASRAMGGMEISLQWLILKKKKIPKMEPTPCPIF